ncbi:hypothetical protein MVEN_01001900 [Mycena venus]|uniref:BolA-like protein n=1 Tax=Mycena venus TaxID=2733690 RepID=A0A8H6YE77_9AGAR|nr:hypothetical protein MVEN_01001900 [Mycena venus]
MPIDTANLEAAIRKSLNCTHIEIEDHDDFEGKSTLVRHRWINQLLKDEISQMHAFSQKTFTPKQYEIHLAKEGST